MVIATLKTSLVSPRRVRDCILTVLQASFELHKHVLHILECGGFGKRGLMGTQLIGDEFFLREQVISGNSQRTAWQLSCRIHAAN